MKRDELKSKWADIPDEALDFIMTQNGADIEKVKAKLADAEAKIAEKQSAIDKLTAEFEELQKTNASAEDYKKKFEDLQEEIKVKAVEAEKARAEKEKAEGVLNRFNNVLGDKKFSHEAIRADYLRKFGEALDNKDFVGKSDVDIFHELTKDDGSAFVGVKLTSLPGASDIPGAKSYGSKEEIMAIKNTAERQKAIAENIDLFN